MNSNSINLESISKETVGSRYSKLDPFEDMDPFEKVDPFLEDSFPKSIGFPSLINTKTSVDQFLKERSVKSLEPKLKSPELLESPTRSSGVFSSSIHGHLRVSLPPEKADTNTTISLSSFASRFRSTPSPTEEPKTLKRRNYQTLKHSLEDKSDDQSNSPILEEVYMRGSPKLYNSFDKKGLISSPPPMRTEKLRSQKISAGIGILDSTPDPPPRPKTTLFAIKPPPLPPKKQNQPIFRPPARPPSLEEHLHYDYLQQKAEKKSDSQDSDKSPGKSMEDLVDRQNSFEKFTNYPVIPRPPQRKSSVEGGISRTNSVTTPTSVKPPTPEYSEPSVLNITLNQLDKSGLASLASTLGIPTENVCNMTLQELTKMLAQKYLGPSDSSKDKIDESVFPKPSEFHADFDSNFSESPRGRSEFDKYAVFKELIDVKISRKGSEDKDDVFDTSFASTEVLKSPITVEEKEVNEDGRNDRYAALRQLSLSAQKSDNMSEDLDVSNEDDSSARADISDPSKNPNDDSFLPLESEIINESPICTVPEDAPDDIQDKSVISIENKPNEVSLTEIEEHDRFGSPLGENWANFDKEPEKILEKSPIKPKVSDNENSPISSDGKEEPKGKVSWKGKKRRSDKPWKDEDESLDDCSAKESYWSDESSHDNLSPEKENYPGFPRKVWNMHIRPPKPHGAWPDPPNQRNRRWADDTEDEYDDFRSRRRYEMERKNVYEDYERSWGKAGRETERRGYGSRRKPTPEFRRRCDSDASDKEYTNMERSYHHDSSQKPKPYYGHPSHPREAERNWSDHRESRSKYKKPGGGKRPSSASDAKRYETMYSPMDCPLDKRESDEEEYQPRFRPSRKDQRYHSNIEHYGSYDRRAQAIQHRRNIQRGKRLKDEEFRNIYPETPRSGDTPEGSKDLHFKFEDDFLPTTSEHIKKESPGDRKPNFYHPVDKKTSPANGRSSLGSFNDDSESSPKFPIDKGKFEGIIKKPSLKGRINLEKLGRQDSSASLRKSESINIFSRDSDPFEDDDFFNCGNSPGDGRLSKYYSEKSKSNSNVSDPFAWKDMFRNSKFDD